MVATNLKAETISMMDKRSSLETEMNAIIDHLCGPGGPGISGNLVDFEGFPRSDIDIPAVRAQRSRLAALRNDHKVLTAKIDENLQVLHSARLTKVTPLVPKNSDASASIHDGTSQVSPMDEDPVTRVPFAMIDEITDDSPAAEDGLQLGDQIIKFGNVEMGDEVVRRLASEAQSNQGLLVPLVIMRQGSLMNLTITPRQWQGRGLLGYDHILFPFIHLKIIAQCLAAIFESYERHNSLHKNEYLDNLELAQRHLLFACFSLTIKRASCTLGLWQGLKKPLEACIFSVIDAQFFARLLATYWHLLPVMVRWDDFDHDTA